MNYMEGMNLHQMILRRAYDWFLLKYYLLLNRNGQCYFLDVHGFRYTRRWLNFFYGAEMTNAMFDFAQSMRDLRLNDRERSLIVPLRLCQPGQFVSAFVERSNDIGNIFLSFTDRTADDGEIPRLLHSCYLVALYEELKSHHGEPQGKVLFHRVLQVGVRFALEDESKRNLLQVLDLLTPLAESYQRNVGSRLVQGELTYFPFSIKHVVVL